MTPDLPPVPPGRWLPRLEAARQLGITERTLQRRMKQGLVMTRHDEHNRVQVYVPDPPDTRHAPGPDTAMTLSADAIRESLGPLLDRLLAQQQRIAQLEAALALELERVKAEQQQAQRAAQATPWWRGLWARLSGRAP